MSIEKFENVRKGDFVTVRRDNGDKYEFTVVDLNEYWLESRGDVVYVDDWDSYSVAPPLLPSRYGAMVAHSGDTNLTFYVLNSSKEWVASYGDIVPEEVVREALKISGFEVVFHGLADLDS